MNWEDRLKKWADQMEQSAAKVTDWGSAEVPEYIRELLMWEIVSNTFQSVICLIIVVVCAIAIRQFFRGWNKSRGDGDEYVALGGFVSAIMCFTSFIGLNSASNATKAYVAPRVVIVEKIAAMVGVKSSTK